jgi:hypothetical protein
MLHLKLLEKQEHAKLQIIRWKEIRKFRAEINEAETNKTINKESMKQKVGSLKK